MSDGQERVAAWLHEVETKLNDAAETLEREAEEDWQAEVHRHVVQAWAMLRDKREASRV